MRVHTRPFLEPADVGRRRGPPTSGSGRDFSADGGLLEKAGGFARFRGFLLEPRREFG